ncbi:CPBP family intramembrane metalloprotease [Pseudolysinimonas kribbensis]|uniref:CAAX amino protease n=1 Tax=Pseudolysinimonas kribbensis TaxID=433641 RepID=A0ABQ6JZ38_9MICO|nr:CPBP family intramembrane glutamic endopeptidase [Pseudolysinimonas kribbensis]GMA93598.1 CAAX amino protease [Pseudolysinimonas kribbensis]
MTAPAAAPLPSLRYHRLLRALPRYRWWRPLVALILAAVYWVVFQTIWTVVFVVIALVGGAIPFSPDLATLQDSLIRFLAIDASDPLSILAVVGGVATMLPAVLLAYLSVGLRPLRVLRSVAFRLRWRWLALCLLPALLITVVAIAVDAWLLPLLGDGPPPAVPTAPLGTFLLCALLFVVLTPIQAAAEEFGFRGLVSQAVGSWVAPPPVAIIVSTVAFAAAHTQYFGWATLEVAVFGAVAAWVTCRTGGLEAAIALHAVNNTLSFVLLATGAEGSTQGFDPDHPTTGDPWSAVVTVITMGAYLLIVEVMARRRRIATVLEPLPAAPSAPPPPDPATRIAE